MRFIQSLLAVGLLTVSFFSDQALAFSQSSGAALGAGPALTEFLARNDGGLEDEDGDRPDWIEIHNVPGAGAVDLSGWALTDDSGDLALWVFGPGTVLPDGGYLVVFASDKDRRDPAGPLHTNFKLSAGGEYLALVRPSGSVASEFDQGGSDYPNQDDDIS